MGIYDRDYYRPSKPHYLESLGLTRSVCKWLIIINVIVFILQIATRSRGDVLTELLELQPDRVLHGEIWRLLTYAFLHNPTDILHIVFNMAFLWWFGDDVEGIYGPKEFLCFYLLSALLGGLAFQAWAMANLDYNTSCIGASGAVTAVLVLCACHFPRKIILLFFVLPVPIWLFVVFQVGRDALALVSNSGGGTAVQVHLAGAAFGYAYYKSQWRLTGILPSFRAWRSQRSRPRLRVVHPDDDMGEAMSVGAPTTAKPDEQLEAKVDAVLEKVARTGQGSLTEGERQILMRASEVYKRRRT